MADNIDDILDAAAAHLDTLFRRRLIWAVETVLIPALRDAIATPAPPPSLPYDPPHYDSGNLSDSIIWEPDPTDPDALAIGSPLDYAAYLEFGTLTMAARPWLQNTFEDAIRSVIDAAGTGLANDIADQETFLSEVILSFR